MKLINFSYKLSPNQLTEIERLGGHPLDSIVELETQFDDSQPFEPQARALVDAAGLSPQEWQAAQVLIRLPSLNVIAALVVAELHGRTGHFPSVIRLRPIEANTPTQFEVAEIVNLQSVRDKARALR
ncbi:MAG TPA: CRISPR-associated protein Csx15 [Blastocatellia bacterium]|nr:CRISPR-associated protein Csx15 [Blastocatellia bacterium]